MSLTISWIAVVNVLPQISVKIHHGNKSYPALDSIQLLEHKIGHQTSTDEEKCVHTWEGVADRLEQE